MKIYLSFLFILIFTAVIDVAAQDHEMTFILLRHAEKDVSPAANKADPDLTAAGQERAKRLVEVTKTYQPQEIFSTVFKRARQTATPLAESINPDYRIQIQGYDFTELKDFSARLLKSNAKTIVVVGHNTTTPQLANLLIGQEKYKALSDSEYDKIFIIKIKNGKVKEEKVITY